MGRAGRDKAGAFGSAEPLRNSETRQLYLDPPSYCPELAAE